MKIIQAPRYIQLAFAALLVVVLATGCGGPGAGGVTLDLDTDAFTLFSGETGTASLTLTPAGGFSGSVGLELQEADGDAAPDWAQLSPETVTVSGVTTVTLTLQVNASAPPGLYSLRVAGGGDTAPFTLRVVTTLGSRWEAHTPITDKSLYGITWSGSNNFMAVGSSEVAFFTTDAGQNWVDRSVTAGVGNTFRGVVPVDLNRFLAVGYSRSIWLIDAAANTSSFKGPGGSGYFFDIAHGGGVYVAVGINGDVYTSTDGDTWTAQAGLSKTLNAVIYDGARFVAVGSDGLIVASNDGGVSWTPLPSVGSTASQNGLAYGDGTYVVADAFGDVHVSTDGGNSWTTTWDGSAWLYDVAYGEGVFVVVGANGTILTSNDGGSHWKERILGSDSLFSVAYGNGHFIAVGKNGRVLTSP